MSSLISQLSPMVIGLLLSPIPVAALIVMLMTARAKENGLAFITGWLVGIFGVGLIIISFPGLGSEDGDPMPYASHFRFTLGVILIIWGLYKIILRYRTTNPKTPRFFQQLEHIKASRALGVGLLVSAGNIKNLGFSAAAAVTLNQAHLGFSASLMYFIGYTIIGSITVLFPAGLYFLIHHKADPILQTWKGWLILNHTYMLAAVVIFVGVMIIQGGA